MATERQKLFDYLNVYYSHTVHDLFDFDEDGDNGEYLAEFHPNYSYRNWVDEMLRRRGSINSHYGDLLNKGLTPDEAKKELYNIVNDDPLERREAEILKWFDEKGIDPVIFEHCAEDEVSSRQYYIWWYIHNIEGVIEYPFAGTHFQIYRESRFVDLESIEERRMYKLLKKLNKTKIKLDKLVGKICIH